MQAVEIPLTQGRVARVSVEDAERVAARRWHVRPAKHTSYAGGWIDGRNVYLHRFLMGVTGRFEFVDHIDRDGLNNTRENLRICTPAQNLANSRTRLSRTGRRGVSPSGHGRWVAQIRQEGELLFLGSFASEHEAGIAYDAAFYALHRHRYIP